MVLIDRSDNIRKRYATQSTMNALPLYQCYSATKSTACYCFLSKSHTSVCNFMKFGTHHTTKQPSTNTPKSMQFTVYMLPCMQQSYLHA